MVWQHFPLLALLAAIFNCFGRWSTFARTDVERYVELRALSYVDDDSNDDVALLRNALRRDVLPRIDALRPGFRVAAAARSVDLVAEAAEAMRSMAESDYAACAEALPKGCCGLIVCPRCLPRGRPACCERGWQNQGLQAPSRARLLEVLDQARNARSDAKLLVRLGATKSAAIEDCCC